MVFRGGSFDNTCYCCGSQKHDEIVAGSGCSRPPSPWAAADVHLFRGCDACWIDLHCQTTMGTLKQSGIAICPATLAQLLGGEINKKSTRIERQDIYMKLRSVIPALVAICATGVSIIAACGQQASSTSGPCDSICATDGGCVLEAAYSDSELTTAAQVLCTCASSQFRCTASGNEIDVWIVYGTYDCDWSFTCNWTGGPIATSTSALRLMPTSTGADCSGT